MATQASRMSISPQHCFLGILSNHFDSFIDCASRLTRFLIALRVLGWLSTSDRKVREPFDHVIAIRRIEGLIAVEPSAAPAEEQVSAKSGTILPWAGQLGQPCRSL